MYANSHTDSTIELVRIEHDLLKLAQITQTVATFFYDAEGQPKIDAKYRDLPSLNELTWRPVSDLFPKESGGWLSIPEGGEWLQAHNIFEIAHYVHGNSSRVFAAKLRSGEIKAVRAGWTERDPRGEYHVSPPRIKSPLALQAQAELETRGKRNKVNGVGIKLEVSPFIPVIPNGLLGLQFVTGHSVFENEQLQPGIISPQDQESLERYKLSLCSVISAQGFRIERMADIGILPDGTPLFVDPDTLREGSRRIGVASTRVQNIIGQIGPNLRDHPCYQWVMGRPDPDNIMANTKQEKFFPNPYQKITDLTAKPAARFDHG